MQGGTLMMFSNAGTAVTARRACKTTAQQFRRDPGRSAASRVQNAPKGLAICRNSVGRRPNRRRSAGAVGHGCGPIALCMTRIKDAARVCCNGDAGLRAIRVAAALLMTTSGAT